MAGGAWKVAYADFVTALFALFLVLWILGQDEEVQGIQSRAFNDPWKTIVQKSTSIIQISEQNAFSSRKSQFNEGSPVPPKNQLVLEEQVIKTFMNNKELRDNRNVLMKQMNEGVLISFFDNPKEESMFKDEPDADGNPVLTDWGLTSVRSVGWLIARYNINDGKGSSIEVNGHTEKGREKAWEMSAKQASLVVNKLIGIGVKKEQVVKIAGMGDTVPMEIDGSPIEADSKKNRRFEVLIRTKPETQ